MSALPRLATATPRIALLGTGNVGSAFLARCRRVQAQADPFDVVATANTRLLEYGRGAHPATGGNGDDHATLAARALGREGLRILVDATASESVAARHAGWLGDGIHVVTACKLGQGTSLARWRSIAEAGARAGSRYGDSATVGAGLPLLRSLRALQAGGERVHAIAGVLSGSLAWLFAEFNRGTRAFADLLQDAVARGYTEPDPRDDLSGEDVRRKLLILARTAGFALEQDAVAVEPVRPAELDARLRDARQTGARLAYVGRVRRDGHGAYFARAGLEALAPGDPLAAGEGADNRVAIWCDRYAGRPLVVQGPGAGAEVTAAALLDDVLRIVRNAGAAAQARPGSP